MIGIVIEPKKIVYKEQTKESEKQPRKKRSISSEELVRAAPENSAYEDFIVSLQYEYRSWLYYR